MSNASVMAFSPNLILKFLPLSLSLSFVNLVRIQKILARTYSVLPAPMFLYELKSRIIVPISSVLNSFNGTLLRHYTTASLTSSLGTSKQLNSAVSLPTSFRLVLTSSNIGGAPIFSLSSQMKLINSIIAIKSLWITVSFKCCNYVVFSRSAKEDESWYLLAASISSGNFFIPR